MRNICCSIEASATPNSKHLVSYLLVSYHNNSYRIVSKHTDLYRIVFTVQYRGILSYRAVLHHIILYRIVSYRIVSHRVYRIASYRILGLHRTKHSTQYACTDQSRIRNYRVKNDRSTGYVSTSTVSRTHFQKTRVIP